jgi:hypothetical protein
MQAEQKSGYQPWQERVIQERAELTDKLLRLKLMLANPRDDIDPKELELLTTQADVMQQYQDILTLRIYRWAELQMVQDMLTVKRT